MSRCIGEPILRSNENNHLPNFSGVTFILKLNAQSIGAIEYIKCIP